MLLPLPSPLEDVGSVDFRVEPPVTPCRMTRCTAASMRAIPGVGLYVHRTTAVSGAVYDDFPAVTAVCGSEVRFPRRCIHEGISDVAFVDRQRHTFEFLLGDRLSLVAVA